jgi:hypothetical protein
MLALPTANISRPEIKSMYMVYDSSGVFIPGDKRLDLDIQSSNFRRISPT